MFRVFLILFIWIFLNQTLVAQTLTDKKKLYKQSQQAFDNEAFAVALPLLLKYDSLYPGDYEIKYRIGACYLNTEFERTKAIPYLEYAFSVDKRAMPAIAYKDMGDLYHLAYRLDESATMYKDYLTFEPEKRKEVAHKLYSLETAKILIDDSLDVQIENVGLPVNTNNSEITPFVTADESVMYLQEKESRDFYIAYYKDDKWSQKVKIDIPNLNHYEIVRFAGISASGDQIFIQLGDSQNTDIYYGDNYLKTCNQLMPFNENINTPYHEASVSMAPDGNTLYFSSNRPGGYGKYDIYKCEKDSVGEWGEAINLGPVINTDYNEFFPFIHPSLKKLYFSSDGHKTMGGFDIFEALYFEDEWQVVSNVGYPINTSYNEISYSMTAKGSAAYLSSTRNDETLHYDIYKIHLKESIPLTLVKGRILAGDPPKPINANIKVVDKLTQKPLKYIYNPNPKTGNYLMIFPPGKDYDMIVNAEGYKPYVINIYIPNQTYFYENFQEIILSPIRVNSIGETIGEEIKVTNTFYDIYKNYNDSIAELDSTKIKDYDKLLNLVEKLIQTTDTLGLNKVSEYTQEIEDHTSEPDDIEASTDYDKLFDLVEQAIETTDSTALRVLDENSISNISFQSRYFYDIERKEENLDPIVINSDTIYAIPLLSERIKTRHIGILENDIAKEDSIREASIVRNITECSIYFDKNNASIKEEYTDRLIEFAELLNNNPNLYLKIDGFASDKEDAQIAVARAIEVRSFLTNQNLSIEKTKTKATVGTGQNNKKIRRVDIKIFESDKPIYAEGEFNPAVKIENAQPLPVPMVEDEGDYVALSQFRPGITYKVQIASGANYLKKKDRFFKGKEGVTYYKKIRIYKYLVGDFDTSGAAYREQLRLIEEGFEGAFVVTFKDGVRLD